MATGNLCAFSIPLALQEMVMGPGVVCTCSTAPEKSMANRDLTRSYILHLLIENDILKSTSFSQEVKSDSALILHNNEESY